MNTEYWERMEKINLREMGFKIRKEDENYETWQNDDKFDA